MNKTILKVKVISSNFYDDFENRVNNVVHEIECSQREVVNISIVTKERDLVAVIQYKEFLDEIENLPDVIE